MYWTYSLPVVSFQSVHYFIDYFFFARLRLLLVEILPTFFHNIFKPIVVNCIDPRFAEVGEEVRYHAYVVAHKKAVERPLMKSI